MGILIGLWKMRGTLIYALFGFAVLGLWAQHQTIRGDRATCTAQILQNANAAGAAATAATNELQRRLDAADRQLSAEITAAQAASVALRTRLAQEAAQPGAYAAPLPVLQDALQGIRAAHGGAP